MKPETILKKAIEKAVKNGFDEEYLEYEYLRIFPFDIIFSHDFAKAFWNSTSCFHGGEEYRHEYKPYNFCKAPDKQAQWQYHLQQMVIVDPIKYLERFLKK